MKTLTTLFIPADTAVQTRQINAEASPTELQGAVGGFIECVTLSRLGGDLIINEEGKLQGLPINERASFLAHNWAPLHPGDRIVGDALIISEAPTRKASSPPSHRPRCRRSGQC